MTGLLTGVVLVLIICHTPKTIINVYESYQVDTLCRGDIIGNGELESISFLYKFSDFLYFNIIPLSSSEVMCQMCDASRLYITFTFFLLHFMIAIYYKSDKYHQQGSAASLSLLQKGETETEVTWRFWSFNLTHILWLSSSDSLCRRSCLDS